MATVTKHSRKDLLAGRIPGAPRVCGTVQRNGDRCLCPPTCEIRITGDSRFACGRHVACITRTMRPPERLECPICWDTHARDATTTTECGHVFCTACLDRWRGPACPLCRRALAGREARAARSDPMDLLRTSIYTPTGAVGEAIRRVSEARQAAAEQERLRRNAQRRARRLLPPAPAVAATAVM